MSVLIESGFIRIENRMSIDVALIDTQSDLLYWVWQMGTTHVDAWTIADVIEAVCAYKGWEIGLND